MKFSTELIKATILKRYKRFLADIELPSGEVVVAHTPNTGSMKSCWEPGWECLISHHDSEKRKLKYTLEMTHNGESWIGVNTSLPNKLVKEAIENGAIKELCHYELIRPEFKIGKSRLDFKLDSLDGKTCFVEVKNVTLRDDSIEVENINAPIASFPDAVSTRGQKHLQELIDLKCQGHEAAMVFVVQRTDVEHFVPAFHIDQEYAKLLQEAKDSGVQILVYGCSLSEKSIAITKPLPFTLMT